MEYEIMERKGKEGKQNERYIYVKKEETETEANKEEGRERKRR